MEKMMSVGNTKTTKLADVYVVTSGKGGVGKTTTTASIGAALAIKGKRTLVVDADIGLRNLDVILGLELFLILLMLQKKYVNQIKQQSSLKNLQTCIYFLLHKLMIRM